MNLDLRFNMTNLVNFFFKPKTPLSHQYKIEVFGGSLISIIAQEDILFLSHLSSLMLYMSSL